MELDKRFVEALKEPVCDNCLGRVAANLLSGMGNDQRGRVIRNYVALVLDSGEKLGVDMSNFHGTKFRNVKAEAKKPGKCSVCQNFFIDRADAVAEAAAKKLKGTEFSSFLVGSIPTDEMQNAEERMWERAGVEHVERIKSEINREVGKRIERLTGKRFELKDPDVTVLVDLKRGENVMRVKSLYISGAYSKLVRGIPQTRWVCTGCGGKGCVECGGEGKRYKTSVQEVIGKPAKRMADGKDHAFHGSGREDIDARCLGKRPFVIEVVKPRKRKIDLRKLRREINRSGKVEVSALRFCDREKVRETKAERHDKTYSVEVEFEKPLDKKLLPRLRKLKGAVIRQQTPNRVRHRRADILRKRGVKSISYRQLGPRRLRINVRSEAGLYIKELVSGDEGRTEPSVAVLLNDKVKKIVLDVLKIHRVK